MIKKRTLAFVTLLTITVLTVSAFFTSTVNATGFTVRPGFIGGPNFVVDNFNELTYAPDPNKGYDYWWVTLNSSIPPLRGENVPCKGVSNPNANCAKIEKERYGPFNILKREFARLSLEPDPASPFFISQLSDVREAMGLREERWMPKVGKPVVMSGRLRFSDNYELDGSGNARGSAGFGLWNSPAEVIDEPPFLTFRHLPQSLFFTYSEPALNGELTGFRSNYFDPSQTGDFIRPIEKQQVTGIDMTEWFTVKIVWSVNGAGVQHAKFYVNDNLIDEHDLLQPIGPLSAVMWVDSSKAVETGGVAGVEVSPPIEVQHMDIDYVTIYNL